MKYSFRNTIDCQRSITAFAHSALFCSLSLPRVMNRVMEPDCQFHLFRVSSQGFRLIKGRQSLDVREIVSRNDPLQNML
jgi:hypothetical protein